MFPRSFGFPRSLVAILASPASRILAGHLTDARRTTRIRNLAAQFPSCCPTFSCAFHHLSLHLHLCLHFHVARFEPQQSLESLFPQSVRLLGPDNNRSNPSTLNLGTMPPLHPSSAIPISLLRHPLELRSLLPSLHNLAPRLPSSDLLLQPTRTTPLSRTLASLLRRQTTVTATANPIIPATYSGLNAGPTPGTVVGITFGSVGAFLLVLWLIYTCFGLGSGPQGSSSIVEEEVIRRRSRSPSRRAPSRRSSPRRSPSRRGTVVASSVSAESEVVMEEVRRERTPPPPRPRRSSTRRETIVVEETIRRAPPPQDEFIEVIEEHDEPPPRKSKKSSGYKHVDPEAFGGGDGEFRRVSSRR